MSTVGARALVVVFEGDIGYNQLFGAVLNAVSPASIQPVTLSSGNNTINIPDNATSIAIIPAETNTVAMTLKGVNGDTGITLATDSFTCIGLDDVSSIVIEADAEVAVTLIFI